MVLRFGYHASLRLQPLLVSFIALFGVTLFRPACPLSGKVRPAFKAFEAFLPD
jgi:hypothetical protein